MSGIRESTTEFEVIAEYLVPYDGDKTYADLHHPIYEFMTVSGYEPINRQKLSNFRATIEYVFTAHLDPPDPENNGLFGAIRNYTRGDNNSMEEYHKSLKDLTFDTPNRVKFRFSLIEVDGEEYLNPTVFITPALIDQIRQLETEVEYNKESAILRCREFGLDISRELGWEIHFGPVTRTNLRSKTITKGQRDQLADYQYGHKLILLIDEGDTALSKGLLHSALSTYIKSIEWAIITYLEGNEGIDLISNNQRLYYDDYIVEIEEHNIVSETTLGNLRKHITDRRLMAHSKEGRLEESHVRSVRDTLSNLLDETFGFKQN